MNAVDETIALKEKYAGKWRDRSQLYWAGRLLEEVAELLGALLGIHAGPVERELAQIASICMNWLELRAERGIPSASSARKDADA
jgi:hypothetical protein